MILPVDSSFCSYHRWLLVISSVLTRQCSDVEERCAQSQEELDQVTMFLDGARAMNTSPQLKFDLEKKTHEVTRLEIQVAYSKLSTYYQRFSQEEMQNFLASRNNLDKVYQDASSSLTTLERRHRFTMEELERKRNELKKSQDEVSMLSVSLSSKDSTIKELCASKKLVSQEL